MKTQISRDGFRPNRRYSGVYQQQGRVITDRDWNELVDIFKSRLDEALTDVIGNGTPKGRAATVQIAGNALKVVPGAVYAGGVEARVTAKSGVTANPFDFADQADFPSPPPPPAAGTAYRIYADIWERTVVSLEDEDLRDPALHGADTCARTQTMAQVKWSPVARDPENPAQNPGRGDAPLTVLHPQGGSQSGGADPCDPQTQEVNPVGGDFLFRVEVHDVRWPVGAAPNAPDRVVIKWSRENGAEQYQRADAPDWFKTGPWLFELHDVNAEKHLGFHLADAQGWTPQRGTLSATFPVSGDLVRRWDGYAIVVRSGNAWSLSNAAGEDLQTTAPGTTGQVSSGRLTLQLADLEISVDLASKVFLPGDFWAVPVRSATYEAGKKLLDAALPQGIVHRYVTLAEVQANGQLRARTVAEQRRLAFPRLTELDAGDLAYTTNCGSGLFSNVHDTVQKALDRLCEIGAQHVAYARPGDTSVFKGNNPLTVRQALDLLADVRADDIGYTPPQGFQSIVQVKSALDELFGRPVGSGNRVTVGTGGQFATIDAALAALSPQTKNIALALMPGDHTLQAGLRDLRDFNLSIVGLGDSTRVRATAGDVRFFSPATLTLERLRLVLGDGGRLWLESGGDVSLLGNRIESTRLINADFGAVRATGSIRFLLLRDNTIDVQYAEHDPFLVDTLGLEAFDSMQDVFAVGLSDFRARILELGADLLALPLAQRQALGDAIFTRAAQHNSLNPLERAAYQSVGSHIRVSAQISPLYFLAPFENLRRQLYLKNPGTAITLLDSSAVLENNRITNGFIGLYGTPKLEANLKGREAALVAAAQSLRVGVGYFTFSHLYVRQNYLLGIRAGAERVNQIITGLDNNTTVNGGPAYNSLVVTENLFEYDQNHFIANSVHLNSNTFNSGTNAGWTLAQQAIYMGNRAASPSSLFSGVHQPSMANAANLRINVVTS